MKILKLILIIVLLSAYPADAADIKLEGISDDVALINGEVLTVGDSIEGLKIIGIGDNKVTLERPDGKVFTKELKVNFWDQTVQSVKMFFDKKSRGAKQAAKKSPPKGDGGGFLEDLMGKFNPEKRVTKNLSLSEKMKFAESDLKEFEDDAAALISGLEKGNPSAKDIRREIKKFSSLVDKDTKKLNDLKLPCPLSGKVAGDPKCSSYVSWAKRFEDRKNKGIDDINRRREKISMKAAQARMNK